MKNSKNLVLVGMMGSGKSTIGARLSHVLQLPFYDSDKEIEKQAHATISEIFQNEGEKAFRELEHEILKTLIECNPCIIATGGGAFIEERNRQLLQKNSVTFYLEASPEILFKRVQQSSHRPLLKTENPFQTLKEISEKRNPFYEKADYKINVETAFFSEVIDQIKNLYSSAA